jgi:RNA polymerase sigma-70 factor (ECF subfamily)
MPHDAALLPWPTLLQADADRPRAATASQEANAPGDGELMERVGGGDSDAFAQLYARHARPLFNFLLRMTRQRALAEDLLQDTFAKVWRAAATWDPARGAPRAWLFAIALNTTRSELVRAVHRLPHAPLEADRPLPAQHADGEAQITQRLHQAERTRAVERALDGLPAFLKEVVVLRCQQQLPFAEIARITGAPVGTLKSRYHRAVGMLRSRLGPEPEARR